AVVRVASPDLGAVVDDDGVVLTAADDRFAGSRAGEGDGVGAVGPVGEGPARQVERATGRHVDGQRIGGAAAGDGGRGRDLAGAELGDAERRRRGARRVGEGDALDVEEPAHAVGLCAAEVDGRAGPGDADLEDVAAAAAVVSVGRPDLGGAGD